jgi:proliferating cell nuclear antigen
MGEYEMKLMDIDQEHLGIPDTDYDAHITLPAAEFQKIVRDLKEIGESVRIEATKEGVKFTADGDIGTAAVTLRPTEGGSRVKDDEDEDMESEGEEEGPKLDEEEEEDQKPDIGSGDEEDQVSSKPASKRKASGSGVSKAKKAKTGASKGKAKKTDDVESRRVAITLTQTVSLTFAVKYLNNFAKSTPLASEVVLSMSNEVPLLVSVVPPRASFPLKGIGTQKRSWIFWFPGQVQVWGRSHLLLLGAQDFR